MPVQDLSRVEALLPRPVFDYFAGSAADETTYHRNLRAFRHISFLPRCLVPVSNVDTSTALPHVGTLSAPVIVAPMAMQRLAHPDGELAVAAAAAAAALPYTLSTFSTTSLEHVARVAAARLFQVYVYKDRRVTARLARRARAAGYAALVLTVDAPRFGRRTRDAANAFHLPPHLALANFSAADAPSADGPTALHAFSAKIADTLVFEDIAWLAEHAGLPVWVKGVLRPDDAVRCVRAGAAAIVVSNHGARQLDGTVPSMHALPAVVKAVAGRVPVLVDSGVRSGEDVVRALAMGAAAVMLGRPVLWALATGGETGVREYLEELKREVELTMALLGVTNVESITRDLVVVQNECKL